MLRLDQEAILPNKSVKPKKMLILALCLMGGGFLGLLVALIVGAVEKQREVEAAAG
jgi:LPS O-antigen subunit length determinant protein (WzzB/FepE family)